MKKYEGILKDLKIYIDFEDQDLRDLINNETDGKVVDVLNSETDIAIFTNYSHSKNYPVTDGHNSGIHIANKEDFLNNLQG